jgi:agmatinase
LARLAAATEQVIDRGMRPLIIGGDHSITYAPVSVLQRRQDIGVVWFDAHTDFSPWAEGDVHSHKQVLRRIDALPGVTRLIQIGYRGLTARDERQLGAKATVVTANDARQLDSTNLLALMSPELPWYISIDIDAVDPFHAPGTSAPVPDGLEPSRVRELLAVIVKQRSLLGADVVEINPRLDVDGITSAIAANFLWAIADGLDSLSDAS